MQNNKKRSAIIRRNIQFIADDRRSSSWVSWKVQYWKTTSDLLWWRLVKWERRFTIFGVFYVCPSSTYSIRSSVEWQTLIYEKKNLFNVNSDSQNNCDLWSIAELVMTGLIRNQIVVFRSKLKRLFDEMSRDFFMCEKRRVCLFDDLWEYVNCQEVFTLFSNIFLGSLTLHYRLCALII